MEIRIAGVNIPINKHAEIALTAVYGVGRKRAKVICKRASVRSDAKIKDFSDTEIEAIRVEVGKFPIEGELRREVAMNLKRKIDIGTYEGLRHRRGLPLRSRTKTNARTRKGKPKPIRK